MVDPFDRQAILRDALTVLDCSVSTCTLNDGGVIDGGTPDAGVPEEDAGPHDAGPQPCATTTFADDDGDGFGRSGSAAMLCGPGRVTASGDCDDVDPGTFPMAPEFCNRIDDDCDGTVDEGVCPVMNPNFIRRLELPTDKSWKTVSPFAAGRVWIAGRDDVWLRADGGFFEASSVSCPNDIRTSWAAPTGQAFVAGGNPALGRLADHALHASSCTNGRMMSDPVAGMWGFTLPDAGLLISGVLRNARRFDWRVPDQPLETPTNLTEPALRFEAAHQAGGLLLIAGAVDQAMRVYSWVGTSWAQEPIDRLNLPAGQLRAVWVLSGNSAFVVGDRGVVLERVGSSWRQLPAPSSATLTSVRAFNRARVYVTGSDGTIRLWNGRSWQVLYSAAPDAGVSLEDLDGVSESDLWAVGSRGFVVHWPE